MLYRRTIDEATEEQVYQAVAYSIKDTIIDEWIAAAHLRNMKTERCKNVYYMSMEFLMGRAFWETPSSVWAKKQVKEALDELGFDMNAIEDRSRIRHSETAASEGWLPASWILFPRSGIRPTAAASAITTECSSRRSEDGYQKEVPDNWLKNGYPFEMKRDEYSCEVKFGGYVRTEMVNGRGKFIQEGYQSVRAPCRMIFRCSDTRTASSIHAPHLGCGSHQ
jgi:starch phosphorylase